MSIEADATVFHAWLVTEGLFPSSVRAPDLQALQLAPQQIDTIAEGGKHILRLKQVHMLMLNSVTGTITVLLKRVRPNKKQLALLPQAVGTSAVEYRQGVTKDIGGSPAQPRGKPYHVVVQTGGDRYACGSSISLGNCRDAGTLGALVVDEHGEIYGLSNNHVTGGYNFAPAGMPILAPGVCDVGPLSFDPITLGYHEASITLQPGLPSAVDVHKNVDAAIFKIRDPDRLVSSKQGDKYDTPIETLPMAAEMIVEKVGRTTGHTTGKVISQAFEPVSLRYAGDANSYPFAGDVYFEPVFVVEGKAQVFSEPGDSGALVTTVKDGKRYAVGLLLGGARGQSGVDYTLVLPIQPVLAMLGVKLLGGHNA